MLYLLVYFGIGFLSAMVLEWIGVFNNIFVDGEKPSMRTKILAKATIHLVLTIYWPLMLACYISMMVDSKKGEA